MIVDLLCTRKKNNVIGSKMVHHTSSPTDHKSWDLYTGLREDKVA